jgi:hypothetical protein
MDKISRKEKYSATILLLIGVVYLVLWIISIFSETSSFVTVENDKVAISKSELLSHTRTLLTIVFALGGSFLLFKGHRVGWMLALSVLVLFFLICSGGLYQAIKLREATLLTIAAAVWLILFIGIVLLLLPVTRTKLRITKKVVISGVILAFFLCLFYFFVQ